MSNSGKSPTDGHRTSQLSVLTAAGADMNLEALNAKRNEINTLIKEIIEKSDDEKGDRQIRESFDLKEGGKYKALLFHTNSVVG